MATLYVRKNRWWLAWYVDGRRKQKSTKLPVSDRALALELKAAIEKEAAARKALDLGPGEDRTVGAYKSGWLKRRRKRGHGSIEDDEARLRHAKSLDRMDVKDVKLGHIQDLVVSLKAKGELAPRTIRHVFGLLRQMFDDAVVDKLATSNPCLSRKSFLPKKADKKASWRAGAVFTRAEVETLLSDSRIPEERLALYAVLFLAGCRIGEVSALRWASYEPEHEPLGKLLVDASFNRKKRKTKGVKTDNPRAVPVHPVLVRALEKWRVGGWARYMGAEPKPESLLIPAYTGNNLRDPVVYSNLQRDLKLLGMRPRRTHDARRTFISLALADGARGDVLKWITHGSSKSVMDLYTTLPWSALCREVSLLAIKGPPATPSLHQNEKGKNAQQR